MSKKDLKKQNASLGRALTYWVDKYGRAAEQLRETQKRCNHWENQAQLLAGWLMSEWVFTHESKVAEIAPLLEPYLGKPDDAAN